MAGCEQWDTLKQTDWTWQWDHYNQPAPLGTLLDRRPPPVAVRSSSPYPGPLNPPAAPLLTAEIADQLVAEPLRAALSAEARASLAQASELAAAVATGVAIDWKAADKSGVVVAARDVYLSHRGHVCRDLQQQLQTPDGPRAAQVTLCHTDLGGGRLLWMPGSPD